MRRDAIHRVYMFKINFPVEPHGRAAPLQLKTECRLDHKRNHYQSRTNAH